MRLKNLGRLPKGGRPEAQAAARRAAIDQADRLDPHFINDLHYSPRRDYLRPGYAYRGTNTASPLGGSVGVSNTGVLEAGPEVLKREGIGPVRDNLLWLAQSPRTAEGYGKNLHAVKVPSKTSFREMDRTPVSMLSKVVNRYAYKGRGALLRRALKGGPREWKDYLDTQVSSLSRRPSEIPGFYSVASKDPARAASLMEGAHYPTRTEAVVRRSEYPASSFAPLTRDARKVYRDPSGQVMSGPRLSLTNLDFFKKTSSWLLREQ